MMAMRDALVFVWNMLLINVTFLVHTFYVGTAHMAERYVEGFFFSCEF